jgi:hypothetical protein
VLPDPAHFFFTQASADELDIGFAIATGLFTSSDSGANVHRGGILGLHVVEGNNSGH